jgi:hypothetical protein
MKAGLYTYAWDLDAEGYDAAVGRIAEAGFTAVNLATSYHAGKFILPHNPRRRVLFAEDGALYFQPDLSRYGRIQPRVHSLVTADTSPVGQLSAAVRQHGLDYVAWTVCLHNSWLGERYPDATMQTAFGDPLIHSLNPVHPDVREYLVAMIGDLVSQHEVAAIELESPGYMGFTHGYHHEIIGVHLDPVQETLLSISFAPVEIEGAAAVGIDAARLRQWVATLLDRCWNEGIPVHVDDEPAPEAATLLADPEMVAYRQWQRAQVASLSAAVRDAIKAVSPQTEIRHFAAMNVGDPDAGVDTALLETGDSVLTGYAATPEAAAERMAPLAGLDMPKWGMVRAIQPEVTDPAQIGPLVDAWRAQGVAGIDVYNYGLMPERTFRALGENLGRAP